MDPPQFADLAGVSLDVEITARPRSAERTTRGGFLFTHRGYSGPAVLDISARRGPQRDSPEANRRGSASSGRRSTPRRGRRAWRRRRKRSPARCASCFQPGSPTRLLALADVDGSTALAQLPRAARLRLVELLVRFPLPWTGDEGYRKAEVTGGGVALDEVDPTHA